MNTAEHIHFIGIGGYGMSAIARVMLEMGYKVTGSDMASQELTQKLAAEGASIYLGHQAEHVRGADIVVYSTACPADNVERVAAAALEIPVLHRSEMLAQIMNEGKGIAVAGAHGKTSTSSMIALVLEHLEADPTYVIGGEIVNIGTNAKAGKGEYVVAEADESDGSFLHYFPRIAIVTNIEADHLENYDGDFNNLKAAYIQFLSQTKDDGRAIICVDDTTVHELLPQIKEAVRGASLITYGIDRTADYVAANIVYGHLQASFDMYYDGELLGRVNLSVPGKHNIYNAMATVITCLQAGLSFEQVSSAIALFRGAKRRFQVVGEINDVLVIDDYAHHPTEIQATISAARSTGKRIVAVFQPQRYTRTYFLFDQFSRAFSEADEVIIADIYSPVGEQQIEGVNSGKLVELIQQNSNKNARHIASKEEIHHYLVEHTNPGDLIITMGAGDIWKVASSVVASLQNSEQTSGA
ncbi:UDP-N-acetylmuramate--L-alanine ligase [Paenibacillus yanchengensis]|uniref:UDP-N-acetylmuramate--L-alanine ligase n=1 Tax=Paenibacillus yanchengensis TaxID=2035833 RepID=A0ABW4YLE1_9BACL